MEWSDTGLVLHGRKHGESALVLEVLTARHGRRSGLVHGGQGRQKRAAVQAGNELQLTWRGRAANHLGYFKLELLRGRAGFIMRDPQACLALQSMMVLLLRLPEAEPQPGLHDASRQILDVLGKAAETPADRDWLKLYAKWELGYLAEMGYGLDLTRCAVTGDDRELVYVSPRTGRAVSYEAGEPYHDRLLPLPSFLLPAGATEAATNRNERREALELSGYFLEKFLLGPEGKALPDCRRRLVDAA